MEATTGTLVVRPDQDYWSEAQLAGLKQLGIDRASRGDLQVFLHYAQKTGLDPFSRQIYMLPRRDNRTGELRWTITASIDALRIIAQRSGQYQGQTPVEWCDDHGNWTDVWLLPEPPAAARVGIYREGFREPLYAVALWREFNANQGNWRTMGAHMIAKCAEALGLRKAFPHDLAGIYTPEEMDQAGRPLLDGQVVTQEPAPEVTVEDVLDHVAEARTRDDLVKCWRVAGSHDLLDKIVPDTDPPISLAVYITGYMEILKEAVTGGQGDAEATSEPAPGDASKGEAEPPEATQAKDGGDEVPVAPAEEPEEGKQ